MNRLRTGLAVLAAMMFVTTAASGFGEPKHSKVETEVIRNGDKVEFKFKIVANKDMTVTFDAPWKLEVKAHDGLDFAATSLDKSAMDEKLPGYVLTSTAKPSKEGGDVEYQMTSFICTADKTQCFREVHKGKAAWKAN